LVQKDLILDTILIRISNLTFLNNETTVKLIYNKNLNFVRYTHMSNIIKRKINYMLLSDNFDNKKILLNNDSLCSYLGEDSVNILFGDIFSNNSINENFYFKHGLNVYFKSFSYDLFNDSYLEDFKDLF
jgi:hypothetical protein